MMRQSDSLKSKGKGTLTQQARLWSGLVLMVYVTGHFVNHALGLVSLAWMDGMLSVMSLIWSSIPGTVALYGALGVHVVLAVVSILSIRSLKMPVWRWLQIALGLAIPYLLVSHIIFTRGSELLTGVPVTYLQELALLWPVAVIKQNALLLIVWTHAVLGLHFWLRLKDWYQAGKYVLMPLAISVPVLSIAGWITAAQRELLLVNAAPNGPEAVQLAQNIARVRGAVSDIQASAQMWVLYFLAGLAILFLALYLFRRVRPKVRVTYGEGLSVEAAPGASLLDISRDNKIGHVSVCGGRARCSTCRVMVLSGAEGLSRVGPAERKLLEKINAEPNMRLACQARVTGNVDVRPMIQPNRASATPLVTDPFGWGVEREVTVLQLKINDFKPLVDGSLPYDVVYILNQFLDLMVEQIESEDGKVDKFTNDGLIAIFGLETHKVEAARAALRAAVKCHQVSQQTDGVLAQHLDHPLKVGIGVHTGRAVIGRVGKIPDQIEPSPVTAIGSVSVIAQSIGAVTGKLDACLVYSLYTHELCELGVPDMLGQQGKIQIEGMTEKVPSVIVKNSGPLKKKLELIQAARSKPKREYA